MARQINQTKSEIDGTRMLLQRLEAEREQEGQMYNPDGDIIISEQEYTNIRKLKELKGELDRRGMGKVCLLGVLCWICIIHMWHYHI